MFSSTLVLCLWFLATVLLPTYVDILDVTRSFLYKIATSGCQLHFESSTALIRDIITMFDKYKVKKAGQC